MDETGLGTTALGIMPSDNLKGGYSFSYDSSVSSTIHLVMTVVSNYLLSLLLQICEVFDWCM